jgi:hypothetical protein
MKTEFAWGFVSTVMVEDGQKPFETAVSHRDYDNGEIIAVAAYESHSEAITGHDHWVGIMQNNPPEYLEDVSNSIISYFLDILRGTPTRAYKGIKNI